MMKDGTAQKRLRLDNMSFLTSGSRQSRTKYWRDAAALYAGAIIIELSPIRKRPLLFFFSEAASDSSTLAITPTLTRNERVESERVESREWRVGAEPSTKYSKPDRT